MNQIAGKIVGGSDGATENTNVLGSSEISVLQRPRSFSVVAAIIHPTFEINDGVSSAVTSAGGTSFGRIMGEFKIGKTVLSEGWLADKGLVVAYSGVGGNKLPAQTAFAVALPDVHFDATDMLFEGLVSAADISRDGGSLQLSFPGLATGDTVVWQVAYS